MAVKRTYDQDGLFYARVAVGSDGWVRKQDRRLCRAPKRGLLQEEEEL